jgi:putative transposase
MPRPPRFVVPDIPHHVTQRGNYRQQVFLADADYQLYIGLLREHSRQFNVRIQAYCLMPNHVHLILTPPNETALPRLLQRLQGDYARVMHIHSQRTGHLWQGRYFSIPMDEAHFWNAMLYVEQNPQRACLVQRPWDWLWSSANVHLRGVEDGLVDLAQWRRQYTAQQWKQNLELGLQNAQLLRRIREATAKGWPLGSETFLDRVENQLGRPARPQLPGPKAMEIGGCGV